MQSFFRQSLSLHKALQHEEIPYTGAKSKLSRELCLVTGKFFQKFAKNNTKGLTFVLYSAKIRLVLGKYLKNLNKEVTTNQAAKSETTRNKK